MLIDLLEDVFGGMVAQAMVWSYPEVKSNLWVQVRQDTSELVRIDFEEEMLV